MEQDIILEKQSQQKHLEELFEDLDDLVKIFTLKGNFDYEAIDLFLNHWNFEKQYLIEKIIEWKKAC